MNLGAVRRALIADAEADAARLLTAAEQAAARQVQEARDAAAARLDRARAEARVEADAQAGTEEAVARRQARRTVLEAQSRARAHLIDAVTGHLEALRGTDRYRQLIDQLSARASAQLGDDAVIDEPRSGGVIATCGQRRVDYTLRAIVERAVDAIGPEVERLWR